MPLEHYFIKAPIQYGAIRQTLKIALKRPYKIFLNIIFYVYALMKFDDQIILIDIQEKLCLNKYDK